MNAKILIVSVLLAVVAGTVSSLTTTSLFPEITQVYAGKTLNTDDVAKSLQVRIMIDGDNKEKIYDSFSRLGFVKSSGIEFLLESLPSKDKKSFYAFVQESLTVTNPRLMNINIDVFSGDGTLIETLNYNRCIVSEYFIHVNDSKGKFSFLDDNTSGMEIREVTQFECAGFKITV
jgi:hypothetical protein